MIVLDIDVDELVRELVEQIIESHDPVAATDLGPLDLGVRQRADATDPVGYPIQVGVVKDHDLAIGGGTDVGLEVSETQFGGIAKGTERVLGGFTTAAPVGQSNRAGNIHEGMQNPPGIDPLYLRHINQGSSLSLLLGSGVGLGVGVGTGTRVTPLVVMAIAYVVPLMVVWMFATSKATVPVALA